MKLTLRKLKGYKYEVRETFVFQMAIRGIYVDTKFFALFENGQLFAKVGYAFDGASGPAIDTDTILIPALAHDLLYQLMREGYLPRTYREYADDYLKELCLECGMWKVRANWVHWAVRHFAKRSSEPEKEPRGKIITIELPNINWCKTKAA